MVTWNPMVSTILEDPAAKKVFDSSQIPGEIIDLMVANTGVLKDNPNFGKALAGIWYDTAALMTADTPRARPPARRWAPPPAPIWPGFESQLAATKLFDKPADAVAFTASPSLPKTMDLVRNFLFDKGLLGSGAAVCRRHRHRDAGRQGPRRQRPTSSCASPRPT